MTLDQLSAAATEAIKTTGYKYFGDYELSKDQWEAVDALVEFARVVTHQLRTGQLVAAPDDAIERVARAICDTLKAALERHAPEVLEHLDLSPEYWTDVSTAAIAAMKDTQP